MRRGIFALKTRITMPAAHRALTEMVATERLDSEAMRTLVDGRSAAIATHAFRTVPFYRERWTAAGFADADVAQPENFSSLPAVTKAELRDAGERMLSDAVPAARALVSRTGGSTGSPLVVRNDAGAPTAAMWWRMYGWWGVHPADDTAYVYRVARTGRRALAYDMRWWPTRHLHLDARAITDEAIDRFLDRWDRVRPRLLVGYGEGVGAVVARVVETGRDVAPPAAVSVTASMLQPGQRDAITRVFRAGVFDTYRSAEVPWIAAECDAHDGLHVPADQRRVDVVRADGSPAAAGEDGAVLVTDFSNRVFPFVRYEIGDRSHTVDGDCACGRTLPRIAAVQGRTADVLRTPSGLRITGGLSGLLLGRGVEVRQLQIVQRADWSVELRYVPQDGARGAETAITEAAADLAAMLRGEVQVRVCAVAAVESVGGKARFVLSELR